MPDPSAPPALPPGPKSTEPERLDVSYRALLGIPTLPRILLAMQLARIAQAMVGVAIVLFTLEEYRSPSWPGR